MANTPKPPAHESESGDTALEKLKDFARRLVSVPKKEIEEKGGKHPRPKPV